LVLLDLRGLSDLCDYQFICSGDNENQTRAITGAIVESLLLKLKLKPVAIEGKQTGHWILIDYGMLIVHVFYEPLRDYYKLEELWSAAKIVDLTY